MNGISFGYYLRKLRRAKHMTISVVSEQSGLSCGHLSHIENDQRSPTPDVIRRLSDALGVTHIGMMIAAGYVTEDEVLECRTP